MSKKRKSFQKLRPTRRGQFSRTGKKDDKNSRAENLLLALLHTASYPLPLAELKSGFTQYNYNQDDIAAALSSLTKAGLVSKVGKKQFALHKNGPFYQGTLVQHPKGFGFITVTKTPSGSPPLKRDPFIAAGEMGDAHHGDTVLIRLFRIRTSDDRPEGSVIKVLAPGTDRIGGIYTKKGREQLVYPDDRRFPFIIRLDGDGELQPKNGDGVIARFYRAKGPNRFLQGKIIEILGRANAVDTQMRLVIEQFKLPFQFSDEVIRETEQLNDSFVSRENREDLRSTAHVTIDGETAKDFDDAICVVKTKKGFRLFVSIADVSHFVTPGSAIDQEAYKRGTSIYFPGRVIPMLPEKLSNNLCSLVPDEDRFTVSAILDFDRGGTLLGKRFCRSIIRSRHRFTYTTVQKILVDKDPDLRRQHKPFLTELKWAGELATVLRTKRKNRGSIDFNLPEPEFTLTGSGEIAAIKRTERTFAHQIIEEFMLVANEAVAEIFSRQTGPAIFRVHEPPEEIKTEEFYNFAKNLGLSLSPFANDSAWFAEVLEKCKDTRYEYIINNILLRSMKQAAYSATNVGHFGLAADDYTHFTSPIRRYPDLIVHRELLRQLDSTLQNIRSDAHRSPLKEAGEFLSTRERTAVMAERDMHDRLKTSYMQTRIGDSFDAIISGVTENALFLEIQELCISGSLPVEFLDDDYYLLDRKNYRLFGEITAKTYQLGDLVRVTVVEVDMLSKKILFTLAASNTG